MRTFATLLFLAFAIGLVFALGCGGVNLVSFAPNDAGVVVSTDAGSVSCIPAPCLFDGGTCHAGYQPCAADGSLGVCTPYGNCPTPAPACTGTVNIVFVLDDSLFDVSVPDFITVQQAITQYVWENQQGNYLYQLLESPRCAPKWPTPEGWYTGNVFMPWIDAQCMPWLPATPTGPLQAYLTEWTPGSADFVFIFQPEPYQSSTTIEQTNSGPITVITFSFSGQTVDGLFESLTQAVTCG